MLSISKLDYKHRSNSIWNRKGKDVHSIMVQLFGESSPKFGKNEGILIYQKKLMVLLLERSCFSGIGTNSLHQGRKQG